MAQYVKLGKKASFFRCSSLDVSVAPGDIVPLNVRQLNHPQIKKALNGGHLVFTELENKGTSEELTPEDLKESFLEMVKSGETDKKILKSFSMNDFMAIAKLYDIEAEPNDKKSDIYNAIVSVIEESE